MKVVIVGGGIGGLSFAIALHQAGIPCQVYESAALLRELGVGINLLPHAVRELTALGVADQLLARGIETREVCFFTSNGQLVDRDLRGRFGGHDYPQISAHRADLHTVLLEAVRERFGGDAIRLGHRCVAVRQDDGQATVEFVDPNGVPLPPAAGTVVVGCDGINSVIRRSLHPNESKPRSHGTTQYRGVSIWPPFLTGASMVYIGTFESAKLVAYPIRKNVDGQGSSLTNWVIEMQKVSESAVDWNHVVDPAAFIGAFRDWSFDWLDVPAMLSAAETVLDYPMVDRDPLPFWGDRRITLLGDAAHPMLPRGSNGAAQAIIDARALAAALADASDPIEALQNYERTRRPATELVILANRETYPDAILRIVQERTHGLAFRDINDVISAEERAQWQAGYRQTAGFERAASQRSE